MFKAIGEKLAIKVLEPEDITIGRIKVICTDGPGQRALARGRVVSVGRDVKRDVKRGDVVMFREYNSYKSDEIGVVFAWERDVLAVGTE